MAEDDLEKPLKPRPRRAAPRRFRVDGVSALAVLVGAVLVFAGAWALFVDDPFGGQPVATAAIERRAPEARRAAPTAETQTAAPEPASRDGVPIVRPGDPMPKSGPVIIRVPGADDHAASIAGAAGPAGAAMKTSLLEDSPYGPLPRIAADGRRPLDAYARPGAPPKGGRVALVVAGLGVGREVTLEAIRALPGEVSLAFSPYGADVGELVAKARDDGHEALIQAPMEPFDYPANDPGPQTLLTSLPASANLERMRWSLGRASGYVGVAPLGGGRFLAADAALRPVFIELARRGLMFAAPGAGGPEAFSEIAAQAGLPHAPAAAKIDAEPEAAAIDGALADLERRAKSDGLAVGFATATPLTLKRILAWRDGLADRGVSLAPISAAGARQGPS